MPGSKPLRYRNPALKQLADQQVRFAPVAVRVEQIERAEEMVLTIDPQLSYSYPDLCEQITKYRGEMYPSLEITGGDLQHDLKCFIEDLSGSANLSAQDASESVLTLQEVSQRFNVSEKTITRWRDRGLAGRRYVFGSRKRLGFPESHVDEFARLQKGLVSRSSRFRQVTESEREFIVRRARRLARNGASPTDVARRIARKTGRAVETIRYTLKNFDEQHPHARVFTDAKKRLTESNRREIYHAVRRNTPLRMLVQKYGRTRSSIHRIATDYRATVLLEQPVEFVANDEFLQADVDELIVPLSVESESPEPVEVAGQGELPPYLSDLYTLPLLDRDEERDLFRRMNYLKFRAVQLREGISSRRRRVSQMNEIEQCLERSLAIKNWIIRCNLRLVVSVARKHRRAGSNFFEMISDGNMTLIRAIERFDYSRGTKFSTYATWAIMRSYARSVPAEGAQLERFRTGADELLTGEEDSRRTTREDERRNLQQHQSIATILDQLNEREQEAISLRFALQGQPEPLTLEQIGNRLGVSRERTRQIINAGLEKLREIAAEIGVDFPDE